jgi:NADH-ubiquinone oxidoreductase chain 1
LVVLLAGSLDITVIIEAQRGIWYIVPLFPIFIIFFIGSIAETNRAPFDLAEAESELVSGFMTEHSAVIFVFFFLAEYASIVLICILNSILFLGGYLLDFNFYIYPYIYIVQFIDFDSYINLTKHESNFNLINLGNSSPILENIVSALIIGFKTCIMIFVFI